MSVNNKSFEWYNSDRLFSHNCLFNFITSNRGDGKTFDFKCRSIRNFLNKGEQFIYLRRYKTELKKVKTFFNDIVAENIFPNVRFKVKGHEFYINDELAGYALLLSNAITLKSTSFERVSLIGFDEFIIPKGHIRYLPDEVESFLEFYETVARMRDNVRVVFMANSISTINPYFLYFQIVDTGRRFFKKGEVCWENYTDQAFINRKKKTRFGKLIAGTDYEKYAVENKFIKDTQFFIEKKTDQAILECVLNFKGYKIGAWFDVNESKIFLSNKHDPNFPIQFAITTSDLRPNMILAKEYRNYYYLRAIIEAFKNGYLYFENQKLKGLCMEMMMIFNIR